MKTFKDTKIKVAENVELAINSTDELAKLLEKTLDVVRNLSVDEFESTALEDELFSLIACAMLTARDFDKNSKKTKESNELLYLKSRYCHDLENHTLNITFDNVYNINSFSHNYHTYEVVCDRTYCDRTIADITEVDNVHKLLVVSDFDYNSCVYDDYKEEFLEEVKLALIDIRYDRINIRFKQLS
jgi:hypothetical protein